VPFRLERTEVSFLRSLSDSTQSWPARLAAQAAEVKGPWRCLSATRLRAFFLERFADGSTGFLEGKVAKGKKVIIMTHRNGQSEDRSVKTDLWKQVTAAFPTATAPGLLGHVHAANLERFRVGRMVVLHGRKIG
jgi:hypothetical protein